MGNRAWVRSQEYYVEGALEVTELWLARSGVRICGAAAQDAQAREGLGPERLSYSYVAKRIESGTVARASSGRRT